MFTSSLRRSATLPISKRIRPRITMSTAAAPAPGETNLDKLLASMSPALDPNMYVFCTTSGSIPKDVKPRMVFEEAEGTTLILTKEEAEANPELKYEYRCCMITLNVHSSLEAIGFLARITNHLAGPKFGLSVNAVAGFYHDHLFIPHERAQDAMTALQEVIDDAKAKV